jgi:hypothetical protein
VITYTEVIEKDKVLGDELKKFYEKLYLNSSPFNLADFGVFYDKLRPDHYEKFFTSNNIGKCPFCGIKDLKGIHHTKREAYDHYIPKGNYPFNSINFKNLAPMCHECNSGYKGTKSVIGTSVRNKAFYPYSAGEPVMKNYNFDIKLKSTDVLKLEAKDIELKIELDGFEEEVEAWKRVFGIDERYKALLCNNNEGITWFNSIVDGYKSALAQGHTFTREQFLDLKLFDAKQYPLSGNGFLKSAFLETCASMNLFDRSEN